MTLHSNANVTIKELDIYGEKEVTGINAENQKTTCLNARLARGSTFTPDKMIIDNIEVGLLSKVLLNKPVGDVQIGKITIDYNRTQDTNIPVPILIQSVLPQLNKTHLAMKTILADKELQDEEIFKLAEFGNFNPPQTDDAIKQQCKNLANNYDGGEDSGFEKPLTCQKNENGNFDLIAKKQVGQTPTPKKKGLSGGAIAGIVIACVVVVAAIIALLVYFLIIKKKNASTTSTQGDSSIAI